MHHRFHAASILVPEGVHFNTSHKRAADEVGEQLFAPAFAAIRAANDGSVLEEKLRGAFAQCSRAAFEAVADKCGFTEAMRAAGWQPAIPRADCKLLAKANRTFGADGLSMT